MSAMHGPVVAGIGAHARGDGRGWAAPRLVGAAMLALATLAGGAAGVQAGDPGNDAFRAATRLRLAQPVDLDTHGATSEAQEPDPGCNPSAGASVWFTFTPREDGRYAVDTRDSGYDTIAAVYRGRRLADLQPIACSDDAGGATSYAIFRGDAGVHYRIQVSGDHGG